MDPLFTTSLLSSFPLYKRFSFLALRGLAVVAMVADPEWQFSAALNKPAFAGEISSRLIFVPGRQKHKRPPQSLILYFHLKSDYAVELISWLPNSWRRHKNSTKFQISFCLPLFNSHLFAEKPTSHPSNYKTNTDYKQNQILDFKQAYVFCFS